MSPATLQVLRGLLELREGELHELIATWERRGGKLLRRTKNALISDARVELADIAAARQDLFDCWAHGQ